MSVYSTARNALGLAAVVAALAACNGTATSAGTPGFVPSALGAGASPSLNMPTPGSWMAPGTAQLRRLLYVSNAGAGTVLVYNYDTGKQVGELTGFQSPGGQCVDATGDVYITDGGRNALIEYPRGSVTPLKTLGTPGEPAGCSVAPNGDVAAASNPNSTGSAAPALSVWSAGVRPAILRSVGTGCKRLGSPGYDAQSHLYVGCGEGQITNLYELPSAAGALARVTLNGAQPVGITSVMWDGKYLAVTSVSILDRAQTSILRVVATAPGTLQFVSVTNLSGMCPNGSVVAQPFILGNANTPVNHEQGTAFAGADALCAGSVFYWSYPSGGKPTNRLSPAPDHATGVSVSVATIPPPGK